jgi:hypothetical protein
MTGSTRNSVLDRGARQRGARAVVGSRLHDHYQAVLAEPMPAEFQDLVAQLVALDDRTERSSERSVQVVQLASPLAGRRS